MMDQKSRSGLEAAGLSTETSTRYSSLATINENGYIREDSR